MTPPGPRKAGRKMTLWQSLVRRIRGPGKSQDPQLTREKQLGTAASHRHRVGIHSQQRPSGAGWAGALQSDHLFLQEL